jgi:perosamine synthetase
VSTKAKTIPWWSPQITDQDYLLVKSVLDSDYLNEGEFTLQFEREVAQLLGIQHAVAVTSGTVALFLALVGLGVGRGDEVLVPDVTFIATANAVRLSGATPVLVDIDPATLTLDPEATVAAITSRTKAIMPVHVSGRAANMPSIMEIAKTHGLVVVEDAAEAFMSAVDARYLGTLGHVGCLSFSPNKTITSGQGGMILTNDDAVCQRLRELKDHGRPMRGTGGDDLHHSIGYNFKLTNLQAAVGLGQLSALSWRLEKQKQIYRLYAESLGGFQGIRLPGFRLERGEIPLWTDAVVERRDELDRRLYEQGIQCRRFWFPIHTQAPYRLPDDNFPNSTRISPHAIWLPSAFTLSDDDVMTVSKSIREFLSA